MRKIIAGAVIGVGALSAGCTPESPNPEQYPVIANENQEFTEVLWSGFSGQPQTLQMDTFQADDGSTEEKPLLLFLPGGGEVGALCDGDRNQQQEPAEYFASLGSVVTASMDYPRYPEPQPFCSEPGQNVGIYLEGFQLYADAVEDAVEYARQNQEEIGWDGERLGLVGFSFGGTLAMSELIDSDTIQSDAIIGLSGFLNESEGAVSQNTNGTDVLKVDYTVDSGFAGFPKPDSKADCQKLRDKDYGCDNVEVPGVGHGISAESTQTAIINGQQFSTVRQASLDFIQEDLIN